MTKKVLVTGATGNVASLVIPQLIKNGISVRAFIHNPDKAENLKRAGAEVVVGDFSNTEVLNNATKGVDEVFSIVTNNEKAAIDAGSITKAAKAAGVKFILRLSAIGAAADAPTENGRFHFDTDSGIIASGMTYTILRPHFFMQNLFMSVPSIMEQGNMYWSMGDGKLGMIDVRDIADCAVSIITKREHDNKIFTPTGPESIDFHQVAKILSKNLGKTVNYVQVTPEAVGEAILSMGMNTWLANVMIDYSKAYTNNWGNFVTNDVQTITGNKPRSFEQFVNEVLSYAFKQKATV